MKTYRAIFHFLVTMLCLFNLGACGGGSPGNSTSQIALTISPTSATVGVTMTQKFTATAANVSWQVNGGTGNATVGTITNDGLYTAPALVPNIPTVTVAAVLQTGSTETSSATVTVVPVVSPVNPSIGAGANLQFTENGINSADLIWEVNQNPGGDTNNGGTIDNTGFYIAPANGSGSGTVTVSAVSKTNAAVFASTTVRVLSTDPLGTVSNPAPISCPSGGTINGTETCYQLDLQCPGITDFTAYLKVNQPDSTPVGTVIFGTGTGGSALYDTIFLYGKNTVENVRQAGFTTVQISFGDPFVHTAPNGWLTGPGGVRRLACRYATAATWVYNNIQNANTKAPFCATGNSGGAAAVTYFLTHYGGDSILSMVEPTSGPPMGRLDYGCVCNGPSVNSPCGTNSTISTCYEPAAANLIDQAYNAPLCSQAGPGNTVNQTRLLSDSVDAPGANFSYAKTYVHVLFAPLDNTSAIPQGLEWLKNVTSNSTQACAPPDAPHAIPDVLDGAEQIATDIINNCKLQP